MFVIRNKAQQFLERLVIKNRWFYKTLQCTTKSCAQNKLIAHFFNYRDARLLRVEFINND